MGAGCPYSAGGNRPTPPLEARREAVLARVGAAEDAAVADVDGLAAAERWAARLLDHGQPGLPQPVGPLPQRFLQQDGVAVDAVARPVQRRLRVEALVDQRGHVLDVG